jgi:methylmalonyl-CoA mutase cobalamin-binding subunit
VDTRHVFDIDVSTGDCGHDIAHALREAAKRLDLDDDRPARGRAMTPEAEELSRLLQVGAFGDALRFCAERAQEGAPGRLPRLFLPLIRRLEAAWTEDEIEIGELSFAFFQIRRLIELTSRRLDAPARLGGLRGTALLAPPPGEEHAFGVQIVADEMRLQSWQVTALPEVADAEELRARLSARDFDALGLSISHDGALEGLADLIVELRLASRNPGLVVVLGGAALVEPASEYHFLGADHVALDLDEGIRALDRLVRPPHVSKGN